MAVKLKKALRRETAVLDYVSSSPWIIELSEGGRVLRLWPKGRRAKLTIGLAEVIIHAGRIASTELRARLQLRRHIRDRVGRS